MNAAKILEYFFMHGPFAVMVVVVGFIYYKKVQREEKAAKEREAALIAEAAKREKEYKAEAAKREAQLLEMQNKSMDLVQTLIHKHESLERESKTASAFQRKEHNDIYEGVKELRSTLDDFIKEYYKNASKT